ncbi:hypothetical protein Tco_0024921 [Tanacetum coccineum]
MSITVNHPIFNSQNELLNSQNEFLNTQNELLNSSNKLMEQMTTLCDLVGQAIQKKEEEKRNLRRTSWLEAETFALIWKRIVVPVVPTTRSDYSLLDYEAFFCLMTITIKSKRVGPIKNDFYHEESLRDDLLTSISIGDYDHSALRLSPEPEARQA